MDKWLILEILEITKCSIAILFLLIFYSQLKKINKSLEEINQNEINKIKLMKLNK